jgi:hypothetical protein
MCGRQAASPSLLLLLLLLLLRERQSRQLGYLVEFYRLV